MGNLAVSQSFEMKIESAEFEKVVDKKVIKSDSNTTLCAAENFVIPALPGADVDLGLTGSVLIGRIATGKFLFLTTDTPIQLLITTPSETDSPLTIRDLIIINADVTKIKVVRTTMQANLTVTVAGV